MSSAEWAMVACLLVVISVYAGLILLFTIGWARLKITKAKESPSTWISVIVPVRNEAGNIGKMIDVLLSQDYPQDLFELIIVNDHSTDDTLHKAEKYRGRSNVSVIELPEGSSGKKNAIKYGIQHARGKLIVTTDADCRPGKAWLRSIDAYYQERSCKMLSAPVAIDNPRGFLAMFQSLEFISLVGSGAGAISSGMPVMCNGANLAYEKAAFDEVGGFEGNEHIPGGDDIFLLEKFKKKYGSDSIGFIKNPASTVYTDAAPNLAVFIGQRFRWVSKSPAYRDFLIIFTSLVVLLTNLGLLVSLVWATRSINMLLIFGLLFLLKSLIDLPLLWKTTGFFQQRRLMIYYIPFQVIYFIFISFSGVFGNLIPYRWKGR